MPDSTPLVSRGARRPSRPSHHDGGLSHVRLSWEQWGAMKLARRTGAVPILEIAAASRTSAHSERDPRLIGFAVEPPAEDVHALHVAMMEGVEELRHSFIHRFIEDAEAKKKAR